MPNQLDRMHKHFGRNPARKCRDCCNFVRGRYPDRILQKCERYGLSHSETSDWAQRWDSCGRFNVPLEENERPLKDWAVREKPDDSPLDGQIGLFESEGV